MTSAGELPPARPISDTFNDSPTDGNPSVSNLQQRAEQMMAEHGFLGVPTPTFEHAGREQMLTLLQAGLLPESRVLEIGCGCLRIAYWLVRFLDADGYCGIEPARTRVDLGLNYLFTAEEIACKRPRFSDNANFDTSVFNTRFDYFVARSIWTHASKAHIETTLDGFVRDTGDNGVFLASYLPAQTAEEDYQGDAWVGTSHESSVPGVVRHSLPWLIAQCERRGLRVEPLDGLDCDSQYWLKLSK